MDGSSAEPARALDGDPARGDPPATAWRRLDSALLATARNVRRAFDGCLAELGISLSQASLLSLVVERGPMTQTQAADQLHLSRATVWMSVDALSALGAIERGADPNDRRVWLVQATAKGLTLVDEIQRADERVRTALRAGTSRDERSRAADVLAKMNGNALNLIADSTTGAHPPGRTEALPSAPLVGTSPT
jgi:MarR family transcriptional regulator for hemolysin